MAQQQNPLASLRSAEAALVQQYDAATALAAGVGCGELDRAQGRFRRTVAAAVERVRSHKEFVAEQLSGLLGEIAGFSGELRDGLAEPVIVAPLKLAAIDEEGDEGDDLEGDTDVGGDGKPNVAERRDARILLMCGDLSHDASLSNRALVAKHGGCNADAREARRRLQRAGGATEGGEMAAAAPQKE